MRDDRPYAVYMILALNVTVFAMQSFSGGSTDAETLYRMGALSPHYVWAGEYWRFLTPLFLHIGPVHLLVNCVSLYQIGPSLERWAGTYRFLGIYFLSAFGGSVACLLGHDVGGAGASGGVFGLLGGVLTVLYVQFYRDWMAVLRSPIGSQVAFWTGVNFFYGLTVGGVCNWAHFGGWLTGAVACAWWAADFLRRSKREARVRGVAVVFVLLLGAGAVYAAHPFGNPRYHAFRGDRACARQDWSAALAEYETAFQRGETSPTLVWRLAVVSGRLGRLGEAQRYFESYTVVRPGDPAGWVMLARICHERGDLEAERQAERRAVDLMEAAGRLKATGETHPEGD